jgi:hypothetical protein
MKIFVIIFFSLMCGGCDAKSGNPDLEKSISLGIVGYNYTSDYIDEFSVDGQSAGNLRVVSDNNGGGTVSCCAKYWPTQKEHLFTIRWQSSACFYHSKSTISNEVFDNIYSFYSEKDVSINLNDTSKPYKYLEVYFYPDNVIKLAITEHSSIPHSNKANITPKKKYPRCPNDKKPEE